MRSAADKIDQSTSASRSPPSHREVDSLKKVAKTSLLRGNSTTSSLMIAGRSGEASTCPDIYTLFLLVISRRFQLIITTDKVRVR